MVYGLAELPPNAKSISCKRSILLQLAKYERVRTLKHMQSGPPVLCLLDLDSEEQCTNQADISTGLWLLHPRLQTKQIMENVASSCITEWNTRPAHDQKVGLIAVAFDQVMLWSADAKH